MILIKIPRQDEAFFRNIIKRLKRLQKSSISIEFEIFFGQKSILISFPQKELYLILSRSLQIKCADRGIRCPIFIMKEIGEIPNELEPIARQWAYYKLKKEFYHLKEKDLDPSLFS